MDKEAEKKFQSIESRLSKLEKAVFEKTAESIPKSKTADVVRLIVKQVKEIPPQHLVVLSLKLNEKQARDEIKKTLENWGKVFGDWFRGGNFNNRLIKMNIVKLDGKNKDGNDIFSLTKKGELLADELIEKILMKK